MDPVKCVLICDVKNEIVARGQRGALWAMGGVVSGLSLLGVLAAGCGGSSAAQAVPGLDGGVPGEGGVIVRNPGSDAEPDDAAAAAAERPCVDEDGDGVTDCDGDCDDRDPNNKPGGVELCGDGVDNNCGGDADELCMGLGTFVAAEPTRGSDANPGTSEKPVRTIAKGVANARAILGGGARVQVVVIAEGTYAEKVTLVENVSLLGGARCNAQECDWARDPKQYVSTIDNRDEQGVLAGPGITRATYVISMRIRGLSVAPQSQTGTVAVTLAGGSPTLAGNTIEGGGANGGTGRSVGIEIQASAQRTDPAGPQILFNTIRGGNATNNTHAILFGAPPGTAANVTSNGLIGANAIVAGNAPSSFGITAWSSGPGTFVVGNQVAAGTSPNNSWAVNVASEMVLDSNGINILPGMVGSCQQAGNWCGGIISHSGTVTITNNVVFGTGGPQTAALFLTEAERPAGVAIVNGNTFDGGGNGQSLIQGSVSVAIAMRIGTCNSCGLRGFVGRIRNNILLGGSNHRRYGVYEEATPGKTIHPEALEANDLFAVPLGGRLDNVYRLWNGTNSLDLTSIAQLATVPAMQGSPARNLSVDPMLDNTLHLSKVPPSPLIDRGVLTEAPKADFEEDPRPAGGGIDIGHDEAL